MYIIIATGAPMQVDHISFKDGKAHVVWDNIPLSIDPKSIIYITEHNPDQYIPLIIS